MFLAVTLQKVTAVLEVDVSFLMKSVKPTTAGQPRKVIPRLPGAPQTDLQLKLGRWTTLIHSLSDGLLLMLP